jgi:hypothetical protein
MMSFYIYWIFAWGVSSGGATLLDWAINFIIGFVQDVFFIQPIKILIFEILAMEIMRPQLQSIQTTLIDVACTSINLDTKCDMRIGRDVRIVQHTSGACRASKFGNIEHLPGARILHSLDDMHAQRCKEGEFR